MSIPRGKIISFQTVDVSGPICQWEAVSLGAMRACALTARNGFRYNLLPSDIISYPNPRVVRVVRNVP